MGTITYVWILQEHERRADILMPWDNVTFLGSARMTCILVTQPHIRDMPTLSQIAAQTCPAC
jgi:hypothetical protein